MDLKPLLRHPRSLSVPLLLVTQLLSSYLLPVGLPLVLQPPFFCARVFCDWSAALSLSAVVNRFKRIDDEKWVESIKKQDLRDNSFWSKKDDSFAVRAAQDLGKVRGRDFRHEKTKKKRASWKGCGEIPMTVNSIQFESDED